MLPDLPAAPAWAALFSPLRPLLSAALDRLSLKPAVLPPVVVADDGRIGLTRRGIALDPALLGPAARLPDDDAWAAADPAVAALALDRWRRAAGAVLEGVALAGIAEELGGPAPATWWVLGPAAEAVDRAAPELGWLWPEAADLVRRPEVPLDQAPRRAGWLVRWWRQQGLPWVVGERPDLDPARWDAFGAWLDDPAHGPLSQAPAPIERGPAVLAQDARPIPPLAFQRVGIQAGPPGAVVRWPGGAILAASGERRTRLVGAGALEVDDALPLGTWKLSAGTWGDRLGAARGIELDLRANGRLDLVFADAFAGPAAGSQILDLAAQFGVSGVGSGSYRVTRVDGPGQGVLVFDRLSADSLTVHPRFGGSFALPAAMFIDPVHRALAAMQGVDWRFAHKPDLGELHLSATIGGVSTVLRLAPPDPDALPN